MFLGWKQVCLIGSLQPVSYFLLSSSKRRCTPFLIASPLVIPFFKQYSFNLSSVSLSRRTLVLIFIGFSTFGRPVRGLIQSPHFQAHINYIKCTLKSQAVIYIVSVPFCIFAQQKRTVARPLFFLAFPLKWCYSESREEQPPTKWLAPLVNSKPTFTGQVTR